MKPLLILALAAAPLLAQRADTMRVVTPNDALSFIVMGDWGRRGEGPQRPVAAAMAAIATQLDAEFLLALGDNFYPNGVQSTLDPQWQQSLEQVYTQQALGIDWFVALGNHDYRGNVQAQLDYSKVSRRWRLPSRYYSFVKPVAPGVTAEFLVIDTSPFITAYRAEPERYAVAGTDTARQRRWIDSTLSRSRAKWKFIVGHHHVYSGGDRPLMADMERLLTPLMRKHRVTAYLAGHEHHLEHIVRPETPGHFLVSGAASEADSVRGTTGTRFGAGEPGFLALSMTADSVVVQAVNAQGALLYRTSLKP